jgi:hypothetical protein
MDGTGSRWLLPRPPVTVARGPPWVMREWFGGSGPIHEGSATVTETASLSYEVLVSDGVPRTIDMRLPNGDAIVSSPISST